MDHLLSYLLLFAGGMLCGELVIWLWYRNAHKRLSRLTGKALDALAQLIDDRIGWDRTHYIGHCAG